MMNKTRYGRKVVLDHLYGRNSYAFPTDRWLALLNDDPTDLGLLTSELAQTGYARVEISDLLGDADPVTGVIVNVLDIVFPLAGADWAEFKHMGTMEIATLGAGNMIHFGPASTSRVIVTGDQLIIKAGQLRIQES